MSHGTLLLVAQSLPRHASIIPVSTRPAQPSNVMFVIAVVLACLVTALCTPFVRRFALRHRFVDLPNPRKIHSFPMPMLGGIPLFVGIYVTLAVLFVFAGLAGLAPGAPRDALAMLAGGVVSIIVGVIDERYDLPPFPHLLGQIAAALVAMSILPISPQLLLGAGPHAADRLHSLEPFTTLLGLHSADLDAIAHCPAAPAPCLPLETPLLTTLTLAFVLFWIVGMMNTVNWLDGLDGLASGTVAIASFALAGMALVAHPPQAADAALFPLAIAGACLGFLIFNWHPARIFLADSGAQFLGFSLGVAALVGGAKLGTAMIVLGLPILDVAWSIIRRATAHRGVGRSDRGHLHHRLLDNGLSQRRSVLFFYVTSILFGVAALSNDSVHNKLKTMALLVVVMVVIVLWLSRNRGRTAEATQRSATDDLSSVTPVSNHEYHQSVRLAPD